MTDTRIEPLWAQGKSVKQLREVCRTFNVKDADEMNREQLIQQCDYLRIYPTLKGDKETLQRKCSKGKIPSKQILAMNQDELVNCIVNHRAVAFMAKMHTVAFDTFEKQVNELKITQEEKTKLLEEHRAGEAQLMNFFNQQKDLDEKTFTIVMTLGSSIQTEMKKQFKEFVDAMKSSAIGPDGAVGASSEKAAKKSESWLWWGVSGLGNIMWKLIKQGFDLVKYVMTQPSTARIICYLALTVKRRICRELSIYLGLLEYKEKSISERAWDQASQLAAHGKEYMLHAATTFMNTKFNDLWDTMSGIVKMGFVSVISFIPGISALGPAINIMVDAISSIAKESTKFAVETTLYTEQVGGTFRYLLELFNPADCLEVGYHSESGRTAGVSSSTTQKVKSGLASFTKQAT